MKLVRDFERRLEQLVDGVAGKVFRGKLQPVELAARLVREADLTLEESPAGTSAANAYELRINSRDLDAEIPAVIVHELESMLESTAADRGWRLEGPVRVAIVTDDGVSSGTVDCRVDRVTAPRPAWAFLTAGDQRYPVDHNRCLIGRSADADISISNPGVSRTHALLWREGGETWVVDLESANGTHVDGVEARAPLRLTAGSVLSIGPATLTFGIA
jgi:hypothetical protein